MFFLRQARPGCGGAHAFQSQETVGSMALQLRVRFLPA